MSIALSRLKAVQWLIIPGLLCGLLCGGWWGVLFVLSATGGAIGVGLLISMLVPPSHGGFVR